MLADYGKFLENHRYILNNVPVDKNHASLVFSTAICLKPKKILELGIGSGLLTYSLLCAINYNNTGMLTSVDNFLDWNGKEPSHIDSLRKFGVNVVIQEERDFVLSCNNKFDLIVVDGNHTDGHLWAEQIFDLVNPGGIIFSHDVLLCKNLGIYMDIAKKRNLGYKVYSESTIPTEACHRGFIQVFA